MTHQSWLEEPYVRKYHADALWERFRDLPATADTYYDWALDSGLEDPPTFDEWLDSIAGVDAFEEWRDNLAPWLR